MESYAVATFSFASIFTDNPAPNPVLLLAIETPFEFKISDSPRLAENPAEVTSHWVSLAFVMMLFKNQWLHPNPSFQIFYHRVCQCHLLFSFVKMHNFHQDYLI